MTIILELAAPGSHQWRVLDRGSVPLWVLRMFADVSDCVLHGLFVHCLAWRARFAFLLPKGESKGSAGHALSPSGFWEHSQVPLGFGVPLCPWASMAPEQGTSQVTCSSGHGCTCLWHRHTLQRKKAFPRPHQLHRPVGAAAIAVTHTSHLVCKLWVASPFVEHKAVAGKQGNLDFVPTLALQCSPSCSSVCPSGEGPSPAFTEIKATVWGGISDCCYNISSFSEREPVCKVQFLITSRFFQKAKKLVGPNPVFSNRIKPALKKREKKYKPVIANWYL